MHVSDNNVYICSYIKLTSETKDELHTLDTSELKFPTLAQISCVDLKTACGAFLRCSQKHGFSTRRQTGISFNPVKQHGNRHQQSLTSQLGLCTLEPDCWALLPAALDHAHWSCLTWLLFLQEVLTKHPEPRTLARQKGVCLKMKRFMVFSGTQVAPHKIHFLSRLNSLVKAS